MNVVRDLRHTLAPRTYRTPQIRDIKKSTLLNFTGEFLSIFKLTIT